MSVRPFSPDSLGTGAARNGDPVRRKLHCHRSIMLDSPEEAHASRIANRVTRVRLTARVGGDPARPDRSCIWGRLSPGTTRTKRSDGR